MFLPYLHFLEFALGLISLPNHDPQAKVTSNFMRHNAEK
jgi:hypothetical protein